MKTCYKELESLIREMDDLQTDYKNLSGREWFNTTYSLWTLSNRLWFCFYLAATIGMSCYAVKCIIAQGFHGEAITHLTAIVVLIFVCCMMYRETIGEKPKKSLIMHKHIVIRRCTAPRLREVKIDYGKLKDSVDQLKALRQQQTEVKINAITKLLQRDLPYLRLELDEDLSNQGACYACRDHKTCQRDRDYYSECETKGCLRLYDSTCGEKGDKTELIAKFAPNSEGYDKLIQFLIDYRMKPIIEETTKQMIEELQNKIKEQST